MAKGKSAPKHQAKFGQTINSPIGRLVFPNLSEPQAFEGSLPKFSASIIAKPSEQLKKLQNEVDKVGSDAFGKSWSKEGSVLYRPIVDGADVIKKIEDKKEREDKKPSDQVYKLYLGNFRILAKGAADKEAPKCYLANKSLMPRRPGNQDDLKMIEEIFYPGCYARLALTPFSFDVGDSVGVGLILKGVQFISEGERLGSADIDSVFDADIEEDYRMEDEVSSAFDDETAEKVDTANI